MQLLVLPAPPSPGEDIEILHDGAWWRTQAKEVTKGQPPAAAEAAEGGGGGAAAAADGSGGVVLVTAPVVTILNLVTVPFEVSTPGGGGAGVRGEGKGNAIRVMTVPQVQTLQCMYGSQSTILNLVKPGGKKTGGKKTW
jgi:hypothetical protein